MKQRKPAKTKTAKPEKKEIQALEEKYWEGVGRRKTAVARVRIVEQEKGSFFINGKSLSAHFQDPEHRRIAIEVLEKISPEKPFGVTVLVMGGGVSAQAEAVRHGLARALVLFDQNVRTQLKAFHFLTRDPRMRERKKFGLKRARRARQWRKR